MAGTTFDSLIRDCPLNRADARALLVFASGRSREWLLARGDQIANAEVCDLFAELSSQRAQGQPIAYLTGEREFFGRPFQVNRAVLVPRPETELLAAYAIAHAPTDSAVLDLGCGSGALAVTIAAERPDLQVVATDVSESALEVASHNARHHQCGNIHFLAGHWFDALSGNADHAQKFSVIVSNPPYVRADDEHLSGDGVRFEPQLALVSGDDGFDAIRTLVAQGQQYLIPQGRIIIEHGYSQGEMVHQLMLASSYRAVQAHDDLAGHWRASSAQERSFKLE